jgi:hypothetical protein
VPPSRQPVRGEQKKELEVFAALQEEAAALRDRIAALEAENAALKERPMQMLPGLSEADEEDRIKLLAINLDTINPGTYRHKFLGHSVHYWMYEPAELLAHFSLTEAAARWKAQDAERRATLEAENGPLNPVT